jgi:hypothetical protein
MYAKICILNVLHQMYAKICILNVLHNIFVFFYALEKLA